ncbi:MAG: CheR family methyltransferase, partial [Myxococcota bacterium]
LPTLIQGSDPKGLRVWIAGCATGQEAYSVASIILEHIERDGFDPEKVKIFATDVNKESLSIASAGLYAPELIESAPEILKKHFVRSNGRYRVQASLRRLIVFAQHDLLKDPPFTRLDLVCCRNVLIYLNSEAQRKTLSIFHFALRERGILFLGPSETLGDIEREFDPHCYRSRLFRKRRNLRLNEPIHISKLSLPRERPATMSDALVHQAFHTLLQRFVPPTLMVDDQSRVVHVFGDASTFLSMQPENTIFEVDSVIHPNLRIPLKSTLHRLKQTKTPTSCPLLPMTVGNQNIQVKLTAEIVRDQRLQSDLYLVSIEEQNPATIASPDQDLDDTRPLANTGPRTPDSYSRNKVFQTVLDLVPTPTWILTSTGEPRALNQTARTLKHTYPPIEDLWSSRRAPLWKKMREAAEEQRPQRAHIAVNWSNGCLEFECHLTPTEDEKSAAKLIIVTLQQIDEGTDVLVSSKHTGVY